MQIAEQAHEAEINQIVSETFETMLATQVVTSAPAEIADHVLTALVTFAGDDWKGVLALECGSAPAVGFARRFLQDETIAELNSDVCDSLGELGNIIAGNLKSVLAPGLSLGTPSLVDGKNYHVRFPGGRVVTRCNFSSDVGPFTVRLIETSSHS
jgi:chemotaxis protein CheX